MYDKIFLLEILEKLNINCTYESLDGFIVERNILLNNELYKKIYEYKDHGKDINQQNKFLLNYNYIHNSLGSNYRITEFQSCLGIVQLKKIKKNLNKRNFIAKSIYKIASKFPNLIRVPKINKNNYNAYYVCYLFLKQDGLKKNINISKVILLLRQKGIESSVGACPELYKEKVFSNYVRKNFYLKKILLEHMLIENTYTIIYLKYLVKNNFTIKDF